MCGEAVAGSGVSSGLSESDPFEGRGLPPGLRVRSEELCRTALSCLFPHFHDGGAIGFRDPAGRDALRELFIEAVRPLMPEGHPCGETESRFESALPDVRRLLTVDAEAVFAMDPSAESLDEVVLAYPGFYATAVYRVAHVLVDCGVPLMPRLMAEYAHRQTGIDIHPGAVIGRAFAIDHGTGVVIGQTAVIGDNVRLYQGVTLGALRVDKALARSKRHPTLEDDVTVYANATILGGTTVVGKGSTIGGNVWLTTSVPPRSLVTNASRLQTPGHAVEELLEFNI
ncbi:MAG: serine acetyltransferase [Armatimonadetes bacterium]|nr:serine acetyltransferase [Armatimonadota bacterium]